MMIGELQKLIEPAVTAFGYELWGCEWASLGKKHRLLRVYVDSEQGVDVDTCAKISRQISAVLDVEDPIGEGYTLEVSSPGIDRPFFTISQCRRYLGQHIYVRLRIAKEGRRQFRGVLQAADEDRITLLLDEQDPLQLAWRDIDKAHLVAEL